MLYIDIDEIIAKLKPKSKEPAHVRSADGFYSIHSIALKWGCSDESAALIVKRYRGKMGFQDRGSPKGNTKRHTRKYSIISISPELLEIIEADLR